jgi:hypothetical protein
MYMAKYTTILIDDELKTQLDTLKIHPRESYRELIKSMADERAEKARLKRFIGAAQMKKMKEVWDNEQDNNSAWQKM